MNNNNSGPWGNNDNNQSPWGRRPNNQTPPDVDEIIKNSKTNSKNLCHQILVVERAFRLFF